MTYSSQHSHPQLYYTDSALRSTFLDGSASPIQYSYKKNVILDLSHISSLPPTKKWFPISVYIPHFLLA